MQKYFISILPDDQFASDVIAFRRKYLHGLNPKDEHKKFPHITLQHTFSRADGFEAVIQPHLNSVAGNFQPFEIRVSGIGHFDQRVIFIKVEENHVLLNLHHDLKEMLMTKMNFTSKEVVDEYRPHITLEKKISKADFNFHWSKIRDENFEKKFLCDSFSLMKHNGRVWEEADKYYLQN